MGGRERDRRKEREKLKRGCREGGRENWNWKTLMLKDSSVRSIWTYLTASPCYTSERERSRKGKRETKEGCRERGKGERDRKKERSERKIIFYGMDRNTHTQNKNIADMHNGKFKCCIIWQQTARTTYHHLFPRCSTRAIRKNSLSFNENILENFVEIKN